MKFSKKVLAGAVAASLTLGAMAPVANAEVEVSGSMGIASTYLWRGIDLGSGTPAVSGDLSASAAGFYGGIWGSSGDTATGSEYDLYLGYGGEVGAFSYDVSVWNYVYPTGSSEVDFGDLSELVIGLGFGPVSLTYFDNIAGGHGYSYLNLGVEFGAFSVAVGAHDNPDEGADDMAHADFSYAYNDNLSFTLSQQIADEDESDDLKFVVSYSVPFE